MSYVGTAGSLGMRVLVLTASHHYRLLVHDKDVMVQLRSKNPQQLNKSFLKKTMHWKRAVKPSPGDRPPARFGGAAWKPRRAAHPPCAASPWETSGCDGNWDVFDASATTTCEFYLQEKQQQPWGVCSAPWTRKKLCMSPAMVCSKSLLSLNKCCRTMGKLNSISHCHIVEQTPLQRSSCN